MEEKDDSFEEILPEEKEKEEEEYEIITGLREKIIRINCLSIEKSNVFLFFFSFEIIFLRLGLFVVHLKAYASIK